MIALIIITCNLIVQSFRFELLPCNLTGVSDVMRDPLREFLGSPVVCSVVDKDEVDVFPDSIPRVLLMKELPDDMDNTILKHCLQAQFKNAGLEVLDCVIEGTMAYIKFSDSAGTDHSKN